MQVEDRLVTKQGLPHDKNSNKIIIFYTRNGIACIGYVGLAYMGTTPMDDWIVEQIVGHSVDTPLRFRFGRTTLPDMGCALTRLAMSLNSMQARLRGAARDALCTTSLLITGWQWNKKGWSRPFFALVGRNKRSEFRVFYTKRYWYVSNKCIFKTRVFPPAWLNQHQRQELVRQIGKSKTATEVESAIVSTIKAVSREKDVVGPNCIRVLLPPPGSMIVLVKYITDVSEEKTTDVNLNYFPWIVGPGTLQAPAEFTGKWEVQCGQFRIQADQAESAINTVGYEFVRSQKRPSP